MKRKRRFLARQIDEDARQNGVLEHVRETAGMKGVAVVHGSGTRSIAAPRSSAHRRDHDRFALAGVPRDLSANGVGGEVLRETEAHVDELAVAAGDRHVVGTQIGVRRDERLLEVLWERGAAADAAPAASRGCSAVGAHCGRWRNSHARSSPCRFHACGIRKPRGDRWDRGHAPRPGPRATRPRPGTPRDSDGSRCPATGRGRQSRRPTRPRTPAPTSPGRRGRRSPAPRTASSHNSRTASSRPAARSARSSPSARRPAQARKPRT